MTFSNPSWCSSARTHRGCREFTDRRTGIPKKCICGAKVEIRTSELSQGRRYYICKGSTMDGEPHVNQWWDEAIMEEIVELKGKQDDHDTQLNYIAMDCGRMDKLLDDIEKLKDSSKKRDNNAGLEFKIAVVFGVVVIIMALIIAFLK